MKKAKRQERKRKFKAMKFWIGCALADVNLGAVAEKKVRAAEKSVHKIVKVAEDAATTADPTDRARIGAALELRECMSEALTPLSVLLGRPLDPLGPPPLIPAQSSRPAPRVGKFVQAAPTGLTDAQFEKFLRALDGDDAAGRDFLRDVAANEPRPTDRARPTRIVLSPEQKRAALTMNLDPDKLAEAMAKDAAGDADADIEKLKTLSPEQRRAAISMNLGTKAMVEIASQLQARRN